jgi:hypothetical protein
VTYSIGKPLRTFEYVSYRECSRYEACEYVVLKVAEWEENPFFQGIKAYLFSGGFISTLEEYGEVCQHMVTPRYKWDGLILAHIIAEEFKKRSPHLAIAIDRELTCVLSPDPI